MAQPRPHDTDPLFAFSEEPRAAAETPDSDAPADKPVTASGDAAPPEPQLNHVATLAAQVSQLERSLSESRDQIASLRSEVETLIGAVADIKRPISQAVTTPVAPARRTHTGMIAAVAAIGLGILAAMAGWLHLSSGNDTAAAVSVASAPPAATSPRIVSPTTSAAPVAAVPNAPAPKRAEPPRTRRAVEARQAPHAPEYVGTLTIDSSPGGTVFVNRRSAGKTPLRLTEMRAGSHLIWIEREGYRRWTRVVHVPADRISRVSAELEPIAAR